MNTARRLVVAGTHSGVGKTTVTLALLAALRQRGLCVQPFKAGPDFIDPQHHTLFAERPCRNLDTWMLSDEEVRALFQRAAAGADVCLIEGVMGLFDGRSADDLRGSTAHLARVLEAPVLLVVDAQAHGTSLAALVRGFADFDPRLHLLGVLCNRVAGPRHYALLAAALRRFSSVRPVGWLPARPEWHIPERHLGLITPADWPEGGKLAASLAQALEQTVEVDYLLEAAATTQLPTAPAVLPTFPPGRRRRVAVARDAAFCFYYQDNLDLLQQAGADLVFFSPLHDTEVPAGSELVYLGGGYPEVHAAQLAANTAMSASLRAFRRRGGRLYAECGGLMYCCRQLIDVQGRLFPFLDLLPAQAVMQSRLAALGYVTWRAVAPTLLGEADTCLRGHVFHYSRLEPLAPLPARALLERAAEPPQPDGFGDDTLLAGYAHLHLISAPQAAWHLVQG